MWSQKQEYDRDTRVHQNAVKGVRNANAIVLDMTCTTYTHANNPDTLNEKRTKENERKERKKEKVKDRQKIYRIHNKYPEKYYTRGIIV